MTTLLETGAPPDLSGAERQVVVLHLSGNIYGVDIASIHTVLTPQPITPVPSVPAYVQGVMNLRGRILPVLDLRMRFGVPPLEAARRKLSRIVIVEADGMMAGLIVDAVSEVLKLSAESVESPSVLLGSSDERCLTGIGRVSGGPTEENSKKDSGRLVLLLDVVKMLQSVALDEPLALAA